MLGSQGVSEVGECNDVVNVVSSVVPTVVGMPDHKLMSEEWRLLIARAGQRFPRGAVQFQGALIKYSVQVGFEFFF